MSVPHGQPPQVTLHSIAPSNEKPGAPLQAVVFDLDGTLIDSAAELRQALNRALAGLGRRTVSAREVTAMIGDGIVRLTERALAATGVALSDAGLDRAVEAVQEAYAELPPPALYHGAEETLAALVWPNGASRWRSAPTSRSTPPSVFSASSDSRRISRPWRAATAI